jgi:anti-anti-sigma regulatory factor
VLERNGRPRVARLVGELDRFDAAMLPRLLGPALTVPDVVLDLDQVTFVDLTAGRALIELVGRPDGNRVVASPETPCARLLGWLSAEPR